MSWDHGYYSNSAYTCGFFREMAPNWLDFAVLVRGHRPPRAHEGEPFRYLELGCGMGYGLCLLAALYPEGEFIGVDFMPSHIAHGQGLAADLNLCNLHFVEADFLALADDASPLAAKSNSPEGFDYVAAHGIATWVIEPIQEALFSVASKALKAGGLFYCSYNTYPGWLQRTSFQQLMQLERERCDPSDQLHVIHRATDLLRKLLGDGDTATPLAKGMPQLGEILGTIESQDQQYLYQEYANAGWQPLYVAEMLRRCHQHKLYHLGSATLPELFPQLLPEPAKSLVLAEPNPKVRETLIDLATMQSFRRDIFVKGHNQLPKWQRDERLAALSFRSMSPDPLDEYVYTCSFGTVLGDANHHGKIEKALASGPLNFEEWTHAAQEPAESLVMICALLLHSNRIGINRGFASGRAQENCIPVNLGLAGHIASGSPYQAIAAPLIGNGAGFGSVDAMLLQGRLQGLQGNKLIQSIIREMQHRGALLKGENQEFITQTTEQLDFLKNAARQFESHTLPTLQGVGAFPADW